ncbi:MAG: hypothetical protein JXA00_01345 [Candidatus Thermoplasmatota archaeon]|nr:hypothetical protein [Candidatus Thermoplasmatota archaeon]
MKKSSVITSLILLSVVLYSGCLGFSERSYTNTTHGFSLNPPSGWLVSEDCSGEGAVMFTPDDTSKVSLVVGVPFSLSEGVALSVFADQVEEDMSANWPNSSVWSRDWRSMPGALQGYEIVYSYTDLDGVLWKEKQVAVLRTRTVFLVTYAAPFAVYDQYVDVVNESLESFV